MFLKSVTNLSCTERIPLGDKNTVIRCSMLNEMLNVALLTLGGIIAMLEINKKFNFYTDNLSFLNDE